MSTSQYVEYLQGLLKHNNIDFSTQQQFHQIRNKNQQNTHLNQQKVSPLPLIKSNILPELQGKLVQRYSRQMLLKQIGYEGQLKIVKTKIAIIGCGGIGCPLAMYLAGAGVGQLGLFDSDKVDMTNMHRQIGHRTKFIGSPKNESLKQCLLEINPHTKINKHQFVTRNSQKQLQSYDLIIDGSDNPECRYIVNDICMKNNKKLLSGACIGWQGQITCYGGENGPCYRCIWGNEQKTTGGCSTLGVVGMLPGFVGMILAIEAIKLILNKQSSLQGHLLTYQSKTSTFRKMKIRGKQQNCIGCGQNKLDLKTYDYSKNSLCQTPVSNLPKVEQISWQRYINQHNQQTILDVRPQNHYNICHLQSSINIPFQKLIKLSSKQIVQIAEKLNLINQKNKKLIVSCNRGVMSKKACDFLNQLSLQSISIKGGITQYSRSLDPCIPQI